MLAHSHMGLIERPVVVIVVVVCHHHFDPQKMSMCPRVFAYSQKKTVKLLLTFMACTLIRDWNSVSH